MASSFDLRFLGTVQVCRDGEPVQGFRSRKALALLAYLAVQPQPVPREHLVALFWEAQPEERGRANLSWVLNRLSTLLPGCLQSDPHAVAFQLAPGYQLDIDVFERRLACAEPPDLAAAVELYRGDFLEGMALDGCAEFEVWLSGERERWRRRAVQALETLAAHHGRRGEHEASLHWARRLLALEPWREEAHRQVMVLLARCGQRSAALAQYEVCRRALARELDVEPAEETTDLYERLRAAATMRRHNLPLQPTAFVGREEELAGLLAWLDDSEGRLVTVCGSGGIGKTRLALAAAEARTRAFLEGVAFVPLAAVGAPGFLASALADALQISLSGPDSAAAQILSYLHEKEMLLVLDGFEHLLNHQGSLGEGEGTRLLEAILKQAPGVRLLVTSRRRLGLRWERCFEIGGLRCPEEETVAAGGLQDYSAVRLFLQAAQRVARHFALSAENAAPVAQICRLVEGMPLAIELAAASVKTHTCREIAQQIVQDLDFLSSSLEDTPPRHRSLRATLAHSWQLLTQPEQRALMQLSVFRRGFEGPAAGEVAGATPAILESLVDRSLLRFVPSGRYELHELLRQYAAEALAALPTLLAEARARHCTYYLTLLAGHEAALGGLQPAQAVEAVRAEIGNVRAAWQWAAAQAMHSEIARSLRALSRFYLLSGPFQEAEALIAAALDPLRSSAGEMEGSGSAATVTLRLLAERARFLNRCGRFAAAIEAAQEAVRRAGQAGPAGDALAVAHLQWAYALMRQGKHEDARGRLEEALRLSRRAALQELEAAALRALGNVCHGQYDLVGAEGYYRQALAIAAEIGDRRSECALLANLGLVANQQGRYPRAKAGYEQALRACREVGDRWAEALALVNLGYVCNQLGDYVEARAHCRESLRIARQTGDRQAESVALGCLGLLAHHLADDEAACEYLRQAARIAREIGDRRVLAYALTRLGHALLGLGSLPQAGEAYRQAVEIRRELGQQDLAMESLAGLARVRLAEGDVQGACACAEEVLTRLQSGALLGIDEPLRTHLTCYRVLRAAADPRAPGVLAAAQRLLMEQAARIDDAALRRMFLEDVAAHRELLDVDPAS